MTMTTTILPVVVRTSDVNEIAGAIIHPSKPAEIRKLIRSKMVRCKKCKNRFLEKHLYERHLRDRHPVEHAAYVIKQEEDVRRERKEELEAIRIDEIVSGGFIPPAEDLDSANFDVTIERYHSYAGELSYGIPARFDENGELVHPRRAYKKKVSPQCLFCDKRFKNQLSLKRHLEKRHPECTEFLQCLKCFKAVANKQNLKDHYCDMTFICFECTPMRNLCDPYRLYHHRIRFHRGKNSGFKCKECTSRFLTPRKLRKHMKMSHYFTKTYACHFCDELFTSEGNVTSHERIHTGMIRFECKICDFKCNRFMVMENHQKDEHGYLCSVCQVKVGEYSEIKSHTLKEHGGYLCSELSGGYIESPRVWVIFKGE
uniref:C2H2-type domain-containing protein n=1 Tax=Ditylenchus dipsaci TaxID=166011 RepID=A0A915DFY1_9BILA